MKPRFVAVAGLFFLFLIGIIPSLLAFAEESTAPAYVKAETWSQTMLNLRAQYQAWRMAQIGGVVIDFGPWYASAPIQANAFADTLFQTDAINVDMKVPGLGAIWNRHDDYTDGVVHTLPGDNSESTYLFRTINAAAAASVTVGVGSDDGVELWLNGEKLLSEDVARIAAPDSAKVVLPLIAGENKLLLKIYNQTGGHGYYFSIYGDKLPAMLNQLVQDFPKECGRLAQTASPAELYAWCVQADNRALEQDIIRREIDKSGEAAAPFRQELDGLANAACGDPRRLDLYSRIGLFREAMLALNSVQPAALRRAVEDLAKTYPDQYTQSKALLDRIDAFEKKLPAITEGLTRNDEGAYAAIKDLLLLQREALLANPLLNFDKLLLVKRNEGNLGMPQNWQGNCAIASKGYDNEIAVLSPVRPEGDITTLYRPDNGAFVGDVDLHFDANKMLFSMPGSNDRWQIWEIGADGAGLRQVTLGEEPGIDNYDPCYLPDGRILFDSTRAVQGVPCVGGGNTVANLCRMDADGKNARQLCFDQDHDWCPTLLNNGRVMYSRWEYSDTPHYFSRLLFSMNPDGTNQAEYYGSNSYWPNSIFYARPLPDSPSAVVAIVSGHHGVPRMGELVIFDPGAGRFQNEGVVQRIPGYGKPVEPVIMDTLVDNVWPRFLHPWPLSSKYFLVSCKPRPDASWGLYLVDIFDNMLLIKETPGYALFEPVPFRKTTAPPVIPDKVKLEDKEATVYIADIYKGQGLRGVPRGTVKNLRVFEIYYTYPQMGGHVHIGVEGPWDVHRILGTTPVQADGSAFFKIPANIPVALQPLDAEGRAVQLMRSWFVGMPGESVSCVGCHERQNSTPPAAATLASQSAPLTLTPWKGPARGFSFKRDVQPVLDKYCVGCHDGKEEKTPLDLTAKDKNGWNNFTPSYLALHPFVRRPGPESDYHVLKPMEFSATTSELIQILEKGHHGVSLDADAWDRLYTWIDLNVPDHGTWSEHHAIPGGFHELRMEMRARYAGRPEDPEFIPELDLKAASFVKPPEAPKPSPTKVACDGWPFSAEAAAEKQKAAASETRRTIDLGNGVSMDLALIPSGDYVIGSNDGFRDEWPISKVSIDNSFWMGTMEVTNAQYQQFDPSHDSGVIDQQNKDHTTPGYPANGPDFPVIRVSWNEAMAFCQWFSQKTGLACSLPTEAEWEWACRAGANTPFWYGDMDTDFGADANLADASIKRLAVAGINPQPIENPSAFEDFLPKDARFDDKERLGTAVGKYAPNPWGLFDMHGNVAEWTLSAYTPYPYNAGDGRNDPQAAGKKVARGGSWFDRPYRAKASTRFAYEAWQPVYNVGFRVIVHAGDARLMAGNTAGK